MSNQDQENLARARSYIQQHNYASAKSILRKMRKNPTAQEWLAKIEQIEQRTTSTNKKRGSWLKGIIGFIVLCAGLLVFGLIGKAIGILPSATDTANVETKEAARSTHRVNESLTPSSTPTYTATATITFAPSPSFTPLPTSQGIFQSTLPPTWTPAPTRTPNPTFTPARIQP